MKAQGFEIVEAADREQWRAWRTAHHGTERGAWVVLHKKASTQPSVTYEQSVEEALCFGWIDSRPNRMDEKRYRLFFSPRKPGSVWATTNKVRVERLIAEGRMTPAGLALVEAAKADGSWDALKGVDELAIPDDLLGALSADRDAQHNFGAFPDSSKRIAETVAKASRNERAAHWQRPEKRNGAAS